MPGPKPVVSLIAALARNGVIGSGGALPWHLPEDLRRFRSLTIGHPVIMGRRTFEAIGRPLPGRDNIVITRNRGFAAPGCRIAHSLDAAIAAAGDAGQLFIIGGAEIYAAALPLASRLHLTEIGADFEGDAFFPAFDRGEWREVSRESPPAGESAELRYDFVIYERAGGASGLP